MSEDEIFRKFSRWCARAGQVSVASKCGISQPAISQMLHGKTPVSASVYLAMGYRKVVSFEPIAPALPSRPVCGVGA